MREMLNDIANFIKDKFHAHKVILFGSHAYGTPSEDSDIDLFVIMNTTMRFPKQAAAIRIEIDKHFAITKPMDIIVRTPEFVNKRYKEGDFYIKDILEKGTEL